MAGSFKTEAVVLRSIRYGEADRVLHLYSAEHGRVGAVAKGVRRTKSRLGGRLEPMARVRLVLHRGRGELCTVSAVDTVHAHAGAREHWTALQHATQACEAVLKLFDSTDPNPAAYNLLCNKLALLHADPEGASPARMLAFRIKLLLAAGLRARAGLVRVVRRGGGAGRVLARRGRRGVRRLRGRVVPAGRRRATRSWSAPSAARWPRRRRPSRAALAQADRAIAETLEHHAHVRLRRVAW